MTLKLIAYLKRDFTNADVIGDEETVFDPNFVRHPKGTECQVVLYGGDIDDGFVHILINPNPVSKDEYSTFMDVSLSNLTDFKVME